MGVREGEGVPAGVGIGVCSGDAMKVVLEIPGLLKVACFGVCWLGAEPYRLYGCVFSVVNFKKKKI